MEKLTGLSDIDLCKNVIIFSKNGKCGFINKYNKFKQDCKYSKLKTGYHSLEKTYNIDVNVLIYSTNSEKYGLLDINNGDIITDEIYDSIEYMNAKDGLFVVRNNNKKGVINQRGEIIIDFSYDEIHNYGIYGFKYFRTNNSNGMGISNTLGEVLIDNKYQSLNFVTNEYIVFEENNKYGIIKILDNDKTVVVLEAKYDNIFKNVKNNPICIESNINYKNDYLITILSDKYGIIDLDGNVKIDNIYDDMDILASDRKLAVFWIKIDNKNRLKGLIDIETNEILIEPQRKSISSDGNSIIYLDTDNDSDLDVIFLN